MSTITLSTPRATLTTNNSALNPDYMKYLSAVTKTDSKNKPMLLDFTLTDYDYSMLLPPRGTYITLTTVTYGVWFTGYITNTGSPQYIGTDRGGLPRWSFQMEATSEDFVLNLHPLGMIPPFINQTQGSILKTLIGILSPLNFTVDVSNIQNGQLIPRYTVDPTQHFGDVISDFTGAANYKFWIQGMKANFVPIDTVQCGVQVDAASQHFTPGQLSLQPTNDSVINDVISLGLIEPQDYVTEFFLSDGATAQYALSSAVFSVDSAVLITDGFTSTSINTTNWTVYDPYNRFIVPTSGFLNVIGGSNNGSLDVHLDSSNLVPLEGVLRMTHGEFDFVVQSSGYIGTLWSDVPSSTVSNMVYGIHMIKNSDGVNMSLVPTVFGIDSLGSSNVTVPIDYTKRYILRTLFTCNETCRQSGHYSSINQAGVRTTYGGTVIPASATFQTIITEIDPNTAATTNQWNWVNTATLPPSIAYAIYSPVVADDAHLSLTDVTVSTPMQVTLAHKTPNTVPQVFSGAGGTLSANPNPLPSGVSTAVVTWTTIQSTTVTLRSSSPLGPAVPGGTSLGPSGSITVTGVSPGYELFLIDNTTQAELATITFSGTSGSPWNLQYIGPNELDSQDGMAPVATIVDSNNGASTKQSLLGTANYNPGQATLTYFKNSSQFQSFIPEKGTQIRLVYRHAGAAIGRARDLTSVASEAVNWGDDGIRSMTLNNLNPRPRTSKEAEYAALAYVNGNNYQHYSGTYTIQSGPWVTSEPLSGTLLTLTNLDQYYVVKNNASSLIPYSRIRPLNIPTTVEEVSSVSTTFDTSYYTKETFTHSITFGSLNLLDTVMGKFKRLDQVFTPSDTSEIPIYVTPLTYATAYVEGTIGPELVGWDQNNWNIVTDSPPPSQGGYQVRYTDEGWGPAPGSNYVLQTTTSNIPIPRTARGRLVFIRPYIGNNLALRSEDLTHSPWVLGSGSTATNASSLNPDGDYSFISSLTGSVSQTLSYTSSTSLYVSFWAKGPIGTSVSAIFNIIGGQQANISSTPCTGVWQFFSTTIPDTPANNGELANLLLIVTGGTVQITRVDVQSASTPAPYAVTEDEPSCTFGRYSHSVHTALPLIPQAPTAIIQITDPLHPVIILTLPSETDNVWGVEVRAADNSTVLVHYDLTDPNYLTIPQQPSTYIPNYDQPYYTLDNSVTPTNSLSYYAYTYNLLGEYSAPFNAQFVIGQPTITSASINNTTKTLTFSTNNCVTLNVLISSGSTGLVNTNVSTTYGSTGPYSYVIPDSAFFPEATFTLTPSDNILVGTPMVITHQYTPVGPVEFTSTEVSLIPELTVTSANGNAVVPSNLPSLLPASAVPFTSDVVRSMFSLYNQNKS